jgi:outer membrane lipoprotein SlyB
LKRLLFALASLASGAVVLAGCGPNYSPDTYSSNAVQQANKVDEGVIIGVRPVQISAQGVVGGVAGAAAGGAAGSQVGAGASSTFGAIGGSLIGGIAGVTAEHIVGDADGFEYVVRKGNGDMVSVAQKDKKPLPIGQKVLVIAGAQARIVPDYTVPPDPSKTSVKPEPPPAGADAAPHSPPAADANQPHIPATPVSPAQLPAAIGAASGSSTPGGPAAQIPIIVPPTSTSDASKP